MCGINGFYKYTEINCQDIAMIDAMNKEMHYRGPDDSGIWNDNKVALGMVRLSIIGLAKGKQPISNEDKSLVLVCNGEIYNYREIKSNLEQKGHIFSTDTDVEVIIHLFEEKGIDCLNDLRGMFAFALWDKKSDKVFIARDRVGKKPLYYSHDNRGIIFSSELKAIKKYFLTGYSYDYSVLRHILRYSYPIELTNTHIDEIKRIQPGEYAEISNKGIKKKRYWKKTNTYEFNGSFEDAKKQTLNILRESVRLRLVSDVPVAVLLSGGIDSSAIAALAKESFDDVHAITVGYKGEHNCDERNIAKRFAAEKGLIWHEMELDVNDFKKYFEEYVSYLDEPVCDVAAIMQWGMYKKAREEGFTVLLSGNGGDELFYGYPSHNITGNNLQILENLRNSFVNRDTKKLKKCVQFMLKNHTKIINFIKSYKYSYLDSIFIEQYKNFEYVWPDKHEIIRQADINNYFEEEKYGIDKIYSFLFNVWLQANCLFLSDKLGMGNSVELRAPFADSELIEFVSSLPMEYKYNLNNPKWLLKEVLKEIVPDYILYGAKKGFTPPYEIIVNLVNNYNSKFFGVKLNSYNQVLMDKFLSL